MSDNHTTLRVVHNQDTDLIYGVKFHEPYEIVSLLSRITGRPWRFVESESKFVDYAVDEIYVEHDITQIVREIKRLMSLVYANCDPMRSYLYEIDKITRLENVVDTLKCYKLIVGDSDDQA